MQTDSVAGMTAKNMKHEQFRSTELDTAMELVQVMRQLIDAASAVTIRHEKQRGILVDGGTLSIPSTQ